VPNDLWLNGQPNKNNMFVLANAKLKKWETVTRERKAYVICQTSAKLKNPFCDQANGMGKFKRK